MNIKLNLKFCGSNYFGWQRQASGATVQQTLEDTIEKVVGTRSDVTGCSRTDSGVHARDYVCNFHTETSIPVEKIKDALNSHLPRDIAVTCAELVDNNFNSRFDIAGKTYTYSILSSRDRDPFLREFAWRVPYALDISAMQQCCAHFIGTHDFSAFMASGNSHQTTVRTVKECGIALEKDNIVKFSVTADAFLYNMVRIMVGTCVMVGSGKIAAADIPGIILSGNRQMAGITAPPHGLFLSEVIL